MTMRKRITNLVRPKYAANIQVFAFVIVFLVLFDLTRRIYLCNNEESEPSVDRRTFVRFNSLLRDCFAIPEVRVEGLACSILFSRGDHAVKIRSANITNSLASNLNITQFLAQSTSKSDYCKTLWINEPFTDEEASYPIAYSILIYKDVVQFERLLRVIYRPQNFYCVHVDKSSAAAIHLTTKAIVNDFHNVFVASKSINVIWGTFSVLEAELACMIDLLRYSSWKYFINLTGQEFPLKTNLAIVRILKAFNGSNHIDGTTKGIIKPRLRNAPPVPVNVSVTMGSTHIIATRAFVNYALYNETVKTFLQWIRHTEVPDETFFNSLNHSPQLGVPDSYTGEPERGPDRPFMARYKVWKASEEYKPICSGMYANGICIIGVGDLERLADSRELFVNKLHASFQPVAYDFLEE